MRALANYLLKNVITTKKMYNKGNEYNNITTYSKNYFTHD
jgi:hypothetical protein